MSQSPLSVLREVWDDDDVSIALPVIAISFAAAVALAALGKTIFAVPLMTVDSLWLGLTLRNAFKERMRKRDLVSIQRARLEQSGVLHPLSPGSQFMYVNLPEPPRDPPGYTVVRK